MLKFLPSTSLSFILTSCFALTQVHLAENAKILFLIPMSTISEKHFFDPLITGLATSGHNVTVVTNMKSTHLPQNVTEIVPLSAKELYGDISDISQADGILMDLLFLDMTVYIPLIDKVYNHSGFQPVLTEKYDLIFTNLYFGQAFYGIMYRNRCPFILLNTFPVSNAFLKDLGLYAPTSYVPFPLLSYVNSMDFYQRVVNFIVDWAVYYYSEFYQIPLFESAYRRNLGEDIPSVKEIQKNVSLLMMNTHFTTTYHRPLLPDVVEVGCLHCKNSKTLPNDLEKLVAGNVAPEGFIYISFGTVLHGSSLPDEIRTKLLNVFSRLKQRVIWKWESEQMDNLPSNVILKKWLPQQDILGHPNLRFFISHAGLLSTQQSIYHGVPVLFFPFFFDQITNANYATKQGFGLTLDVWTFSEEELETSIRRILTEPQIKERAKTMSEIFKDQMNGPLEKALFWTNHVLKFKGAPHLRSSARNLNFYQFHSIDVVLFLTVCLLAFVFITVYLVKTIFSITFKSNTKAKQA